MRILWRKAVVVCFAASIVLPLDAKIVQCPRDIQAFDPSDPSKVIGTFIAGSELETNGEINAKGMVAVTYRPKEGQIIKALCNSDDLGLKKEAGTEGVSSPGGETSEFASISRTQDLVEGLRLAAQGKKFLFIKYGREACENCQTLGQMMKSEQIGLNAKEFVVAEINCDDPNQKKMFRQRFRVEGTTLPFIVIADGSGKQLAARSGYGEPEDFKNLISEAKKTAGKP